MCFGMGSHAGHEGREAFLCHLWLMPAVTAGCQIQPYQAQACLLSLLMAGALPLYAGHLSIGASFEYGKSFCTSHNSFSDHAGIDGDSTSWYMGAGNLEFQWGAGCQDGRVRFGEKGGGPIPPPCSTMTHATNTLPPAMNGAFFYLPL